MEVKMKHSIQVVPITLEKHQNSDFLSVVRVKGYTVVVKTEDWIGKDRGIYIPPDYVVSDRPEFSFLGNSRRIRVKKLRGVYSEGLLIEAPDGAEIGEDFMERLGVVRYEPPESITTSGQDAKAPDLSYIPVYDLENIENYPDILEDGEPVIVTEKIHGTSARYVYHDGQLHIGSRKTWKVISSDLAYYKAIAARPDILEWLMDNPGVVLYGEVYGWVQDLRYGHSVGKVSVAIFDVYLPALQKWFYPGLGMSAFSVPTLYEGPFSTAMVEELREGQSLLGPNIKEGIVIAPKEQRLDEEIGRVKLKAISRQYLAKGSDG
jgi:RNA ligase (TIGR02306 family)